MNYITLIVACLLFSFQFIFSKWYQLRTDSTLKAALWMTVFDGTWLFILFFTANGFAYHVTASSMVYASLYSFFIIVCSVSALFAMRHGKVAVVSLFMLTGGLVFPVLYGVIMLGETLNLQKIIGLSLIILSFFPSILLKKGSFAKTNADDQVKIKLKLRYWLLCFVVFTCNGMISVITKAHSISPDASPEKDFLIFAAILRFIAGIIIIISLTKGRIFKNLLSKIHCGIGKIPFPKKSFILLMIVGGYTLCNGIANVLSMITAKTMDSSLQFPLLSGIVVVMTAFISWIVYKEKPSPGDTIGINLTLIGIVFMVF